MSATALIPPRTARQAERQPAAIDNPVTGGTWKHDPVFVMALGMCPSLAVTNSVRNAAGMGLATAFVLVCTGGLISTVRRLVSEQFRTTAHLLVIATAVTIVDSLMRATHLGVYKALGAYVPLIVANCFILERSEAYAGGRMPVLQSIRDGLGRGLRFAFALSCLGAVRELLGAGTFLDMPLFGPAFEPWVVFLLPPGGFLLLAILLAAFTIWRERNTARRGHLA